MSGRPALHVMQGRLLPPRDGRIQAFPAGDWQRELELAPRAGVEGVEWIYEVYGADDNPLASDHGAAALADTAAVAGTAVESCCADWFMDRPLHRADGAEREARIGELEALVERCAAARIRRVVLPFVDASAMRGEQDVDVVVGAVERVAPRLADTGLELHLETDFGPDEFGRLLARLDDPRVKANYDIGNSAALGFDFEEEFASYGARIGSVHVKDRVRGGTTVPLGSGDADLPGVLAALAERGWERPLVLQAARGEDGGEVQTVRGYSELVARHWAEAERELGARA
jgi:hexulose-6-phosphate isomerase